MDWREVWKEVEHEAYGVKVPPDLIAHSFSGREATTVEGVKVYAYLTVIDVAFWLVEEHLVRGDQYTIQSLKEIEKDLEDLEKKVSKDKRKYIRASLNLIRKARKVYEDENTPLDEVVYRLKLLKYVEQILSYITEDANSYIEESVDKIVTKMFDTIKRLIAISYKKEKKTVYE